MTISLDKYLGCFLGLALGDALGAPFEGGPVERLAWRMIGKTSDGLYRWTDDTQMSLDIASSIIEHKAVVVDDIALRFAASYRWSRGYGPGAARVLKQMRKGIHWHKANRAAFADGSYGNGAAMRSPVLALVSPRNTKKLVDYTRAVGEITHAHALALEGAVVISVATSETLLDSDVLDTFDAATAFCVTPQFTERVGLARAWLANGDRPSTSEVARKLGNGIAAVDSCITALYLASRFRQDDFSALQGFAIGCKGDVDTILAMAAAIWGASHGAAALPSVSLSLLEGREHIERVTEALYDLSVRTGFGD